MMRERNIVSILIMLLGRNQRDAKFLAIVVDSLYWLTHGNRDAKMLMLNMGGTQQLISLLYNHSMQYPKLILNTIRVLKVWLQILSLYLYTELQTNINFSIGQNLFEINLFNTKSFIYTFYYK